MTPISLTSQFDDSPLMQAFVAAVVAQYDDLITDIVAISSIGIGTAEGDQLDIYGQLAGVTRPDMTAYSEEEYRNQIKAAFKMLVSSGTIEEVVAIMTLVLGTATTQLVRAGDAYFQLNFEAATQLDEGHVGNALAALERCVPVGVSWDLYEIVEDGMNMFFRFDMAARGIDDGLLLGRLLSTTTVETPLGYSRPEQSLDWAADGVKTDLADGYFAGYSTSDVAVASEWNYQMYWAGQYLDHVFANCPAKYADIDDGITELGADHLFAVTDKTVAVATLRAAHSGDIATCRGITLTITETAGETATLTATGGASWAVNLWAAADLPDVPDELDSGQIGPNLFGYRVTHNGSIAIASVSYSASAYDSGFNTVIVGINRFLVVNVIDGSIIYDLLPTEWTFFTQTSVGSPYNEEIAANLAFKILEDRIVLVTYYIHYEDTLDTQLELARNLLLDFGGNIIRDPAFDLPDIFTTRCGFSDCYCGLLVFPETDYTNKNSTINGYSLATGELLLTRTTEDIYADPSDLEQYGINFLEHLPILVINDQGFFAISVFVNNGIYDYIGTAFSLSALSSDSPIAVHAITSDTLGVVKNALGNFEYTNSGDTYLVRYFPNASPMILPVAESLPPELVWWQEGGYRRFRARMRQQIG